jgi:hypothetical protein
MLRHATGLRTLGVAIVQVLATYGSFEFGGAVGCKIAVGIVANYDILDHELAGVAC